tara:strand:+ start:303 stop:1106 length:804 start_codon:yes stop_codon:yes gene_type:complete
MTGTENRGGKDPSNIKTSEVDDAISVGKSAATGFLAGGSVGGGIAAALSAVSHAHQYGKFNNLVLETDIKKIEESLIENPASILTNYHMYSFVYANFALLFMILFAYLNGKVDFFWSVADEVFCQSGRWACLMETKINVLFVFINFVLLLYAVMSIFYVKTISYAYFLKALSARKKRGTRGYFEGAYASVTVPILAFCCLPIFSDSMDIISSQYSFHGLNAIVAKNIFIVFITGAIMYMTPAYILAGYFYNRDFLPLISSGPTDDSS